MSGVVYKSLDFLGYPNYRVGDDGSVWSKARGQWKKLKPRPDTKNHLMASLSCEGRARNFYIHHLVLFAFVGPRPDGMEACHSPDWNPHNNKVTNLRWDTHQANIHDSMKHGTRVCNKGENNPSRKLNWQQVRDIRALRKAKMSLRKLAQKYGIDRSTVDSICSGRSWKE